MTTPNETRDEDLLLGDDLDDQALYGADEDELLLTDEELEKDVTNEEKQQIKAEAEQWVREQMQEQHKRPQRKASSANNNARSNEDFHKSVNTTNTKVAPVATTEVSSTANHNNRLKTVSESPSSGIAQGDGVSTSEATAQQILEDSKTTKDTREINKVIDPQSAQTFNRATNVGGGNAEDTISSSSRDIDIDHVSLISCSTTENVTDSSILASSQESLTGVIRDFSDPREDCDDEREERTNIKTTNEREVESASSSDQSPDVHPRYGQNKRIFGEGPHSLIRPHRYSARPPYHTGPLRPMMNRGIYPSIPHGHFPLQHPASNTPPHNMYGSTVAHTTQQQTHGGLPSSPPNPLNQMSPPHEMMPRIPLRHPYPGFRPGSSMPGIGVNFRHPMHQNMYGPQDYNSNGPSHGPSQYAHNFIPHPPGVRGMFRPELQQGIQLRVLLPSGLRMQRASLAQHNLPGSGGFPSVPQGVHRPQLAPQQSTQTGITSIAPNASSVTSLSHGVGGAVSSNPVSGPTLRPSKVLINPNFKGGVEAATSKFIQETQYMAAIGGVPRSDDELLRQQEEFINKNRQHIEKRRNERTTSPATARRNSRSRSRTRSRTRSRSHERSYTPPSKRTGAPVPAERHFERERERRGNLTRAGSRDRERERGERDRVGPSAFGNRAGGNRFRRGNSRDRGGPNDYENRGGNSAGLSNYNKRRRSVSPSGNRGNGNFGGRRGRSGDRDRNEEDDETRAYRLKIEKQKELREQLMRDKEMKRRRAAEEKLHEDKRAVPQPGNANPTSSQGNKANSNNNNSSHDEPLKFKPIIVTQPKIISLKKRQQASEHSSERQRQRSSSPSGPPPRRHLPTAKILPEAKRTLTEHLTNAGGVGNIGGVSGGHSSNTAVIKPVQKLRDMSRTKTPPLTAIMITSTSLPSKHTRRLSTPSDDEVQLDYDEDELMLEEEDRLLATPTPSPTHPSVTVSRTPSPEPPPTAHSYRRKTQKASSNSSGAKFSTSNRRVVIKPSSERSGTESTNARNRSGSNRQRDSASSSVNSIQSSRKGIFDRLDVRSGGSSGAGSGSGAGSDSKRKPHRIVLKKE